jgi:N-acetylglucosamine kinase-like BadF-type ATPase
VGDVNDGVIVAVDGGGSKTDAVAFSREGALIARASGPGSSPHFLGLEAAVRRVDELVRDVAGECPVIQANLYLSGVDFPAEIADFMEAIADYAWSSTTTVVSNDLFALLRAGTAAPNAVAVVCGTGINAIGIREDGAVARFAALGDISGDWGGGTGIGEQALWHVARAADLRGPATSLSAVLPGVYGRSTVDEVIQALHMGDIAYADLGRLSPLVFDHSDAGDPIARSLVDRQATEIALMARSCVERLGMQNIDVPIVIGGGVLSGRNPRLLTGIETRLADVIPRSTLIHITRSPIEGAALLALESAGAGVSVLERARKELE